MKKNMILAAAMIAASVSAASIGVALADNHGSKNEAAEIQSMLGAKITAVQAAQAAEVKAGGKAASVSFEGENGKPFYEVEIVTTDEMRQDVSVDATSGEVTKMAAAQEDEQSGQNGDENGESENGESGENVQQ
ncbi:PepSY domain-containing protein [Mesorhizobium sp. NBSH29]|uniref:PepSY domain-containing protein n=1 Tax=Mesorhizobium sp. NBSH29 TaxID=2654249 RepID=UPI00189673F3|nr:PepSY domain-containing protein [Mesorhizobium sp. NBSH29]